MQRLAHPVRLPIYTYNRRRAAWPMTPNESFIDCPLLVQHKDRIDGPLVRLPIWHTNAHPT